MARKTKKGWTKSMTLHMNGGSEFSELHYKILHDGKESGITQHIRTDGSPDYKEVANEFHAGEATFDLLKDKGLDAWLEANAIRSEK